MTFYKEADCFQRWKFISYKLKQCGIFKTELQCRDRFFNHIDPSLKHVKLSKIQISKLFAYYNLYGPRWSFFQSKLQGRSQTELKNKFHSINRSFIRQFVKFMNKKKIKKLKISSAHLSSRLITDIYQGRKNFSRFKDFMKNSLKFFKYQIRQEIAQSYFNSLPFCTLESLYRAIHQDLITKTQIQIYQSSNEHKQQNNTKKNSYQLQQCQTQLKDIKHQIDDKQSSEGQVLSAKISVLQNENCNFLIATPFTWELVNIVWYFCKT